MIDHLELSQVIPLWVNAVNYHLEEVNSSKTSWAHATLCLAFFLRWKTNARRSSARVHLNSVTLKAVQGCRLTRVPEQPHSVDPWGRNVRAGARVRPLWFADRPQTPNEADGTHFNMSWSRTKKALNYVRNDTQSCAYAVLSGSITAKTLTTVRRAKAANTTVHVVSSG